MTAIPLRPARSLVLILFTFATLTVVQVAVPLRLHQLRVDGVTLGLVLALPSLTGLFVEAPFASLSDVAGRRSVISLGAVVLVAAAAGMTLAQNAWALAGSLVLYGAGLGALTSALMAALSESVPPERSAHVQGLNGAVQRLGAMGVAGLVTVTSRPSAMLGFVGVAGIACLALAATVPRWRFTRGGGPRLRDTYRTALALLRRERLVQVGALYNILLGVLFITTNSFIALILLTSKSPVHLGVLLLARDLTSVLLAPAFGLLAARLGWQRCLVSGMVAGAGSMTLGIVIPSDSGWLYPLFACCGVAIGFGIAGANLAATYGTQPAERALGMVAAGYCGRLASLLAPVILACAFSVFAAAGVFAVSAAIALAATARAVWILRRES